MICVEPQIGGVRAVLRGKKNAVAGRDGRFMPYAAGESGTEIVDGRVGQRVLVEVFVSWRRVRLALREEVDLACILRPGGIAHGCGNGLQLLRMREIGDRDDP